VNLYGRAIKSSLENTVTIHVRLAFLLALVAGPALLPRTTAAQETKPAAAAAFSCMDQRRAFMADRVAMSPGALRFDVQERRHA